MPIKNFYDLKPTEAVCHDGEGKIKIVNVFENELAAPLRYIHYTSENEELKILVMETVN
ncbi:MAG: hypothetical protein FWC06_03730 [Treponema sp.]|nr:hypothetical protein [Treponema sp.]